MSQAAIIRQLSAPVSMLDTTARFLTQRAYPRIMVDGIRLIQSATFLFSNENRRQAFGA